MTGCTQCDGTGWYAYDEIHSKPCEDCCTHPADKRYVQSEGHPKPGVWTCSMCGTELSAKPDVTNEVDMTDKSNIIPLGNITKLDLLNIEQEEENANI